jgi:hypothetical protein
VRAPFDAGRVAFTKIWDGCLAVIIKKYYALRTIINTLAAASTYFTIDIEPFSIKSYSFNRTI